MPLNFHSKWAFWFDVSELHLIDRVLSYIHTLFFFFLPPPSVASWFLSPLLSGFTSAVLFYFVRMFILQKVSTRNLSLLALWVTAKVV